MFKIWGICIFVLLFISGCGENACIDADDFGFNKITISSNGSNVQGEGANQYSEWTPTPLVMNGEELYILVRGGGTAEDADPKSEWTGWYCSSTSNQVCDFIKVNSYHTCKSPNWCPNPGVVDKYLEISNAPCVFRQGKGLYGLVTDPRMSNQNPNKGQAILDPGIINAYTFHLGEVNNLSVGRLKNLGGYRGSLPEDRFGGQLYFKILDNYYPDNGGQYSLIVKTGAVNPNPGPMQWIIEFIKGKLDDASTKIFKNITANADYRQAVKISLLLFIVVTVLSFLVGLVNITQKELMSRLLKFAIVAQLLTGDNSWEFFNNYLFKFFTNGLEEIVSIILKSVTRGEISGFAFFDSVLDLFISEETTAKIWSLLRANLLIALFVIPCMYITIYYFLEALMKGVIFFLVSYIAISLLIVLAPIFIVFVLFQVTRSFFETWLKQLINYFLQPLLIFAALGLMAQVIINQMYKMFGFAVCWTSWIELFGITIVKFWQPVPVNLDLKEVIDIPGYVIDPNNPDRTCAPYECQAERLVDLPFLDIEKDSELIDSFTGWYWELFPETLMLLLLTYLMLKFNDTVPAIARGIAGATASQADIDGAVAGIQGGLPARIISKPINFVTGGLKRFAAGGARRVGGAILKRSSTLRSLKEFREELGSATDNIGLVPKSLRKRMEAFDKGVAEAQDYNFGKKYDKFRSDVDSIKNKMSFGLAGKDVELDEAKRFSTLVNQEAESRVRGSIESQRKQAEKDNKKFNGPSESAISQMIKNEEKNIENEVKEYAQKIDEPLSQYKTEKTLLKERYDRKQANKKKSRDGKGIVSDKTDGLKKSRDGQGVINDNSNNPKKKR